MCTSYFSIYVQVPDAQVIIVGTHVDHPALSRTTLEHIWQQLRQLLSYARGHHQRQFGHTERLAGCLLCQTDPRCRPRSTDSLSAVPTDRGHAADRGHGGDLGHGGSGFINHAFDAGDTTCTEGTDAGTLHCSDDDSETTTTNCVPVRCDADDCYQPGLVSVWTCLCTTRD